MISKLVHFITTDIWRIRVRDLSRAKALFLKPLMIIILALRSFDEDKCQLRASALTFYSLLSVVPVAAMAFGIAKGFGFESRLEGLLLDKMPAQQEVVQQIITFSHSLLENTKGGMIAGIGVAILFWTVIKVLGNIEKSFNDIWGIKKSRSLGRKFSDYLSIMLVCPLLLIMASSITVAITSKAALVIEKISFLAHVSDALLFVLNILPYAVLWILFTFIYIFMPNTNVKIKSGVLAGIAAGTVYQIVQWAYISFQVGVAKYNAIYGGFAALPLFLMWLQMSWLIVLFGAEIAFARQNLETYEFEPDCLRISYSYKKLLTLRLMQLLVSNFCRAQKPQDASKISHDLEIPIRLVRQILFELVEAGLVAEVNLQKNAVAYQPARCTHKMKIKDVIDSLEERGTDNIPVKKTKELEKIEETLNVFSKIQAESDYNVNLEEI